jgi:hypothetical protein
MTGHCEAEGPGVLAMVTVMQFGAV